MTALEEDSISQLTMDSGPTPTSATSLGSRAVDSYEVRRKQAGKPQYSQQSSVYPQGDRSGSDYTTPTRNPTIPKSPQHIRGIQNPNPVGDSVHTQIPPIAQNNTLHSTDVDLRHNQNLFSLNPLNPDSAEEKSPRSPIHNLSDLGLDFLKTPISKSPNSKTSNLTPVRAPPPVGGSQHEATPVSSPTRLLQGVSQEAGNRKDSSARISSLVNTIEEEMLQSGVNVSFSKFKDHLIQLQEAGLDFSSKIVIEGDYAKVAQPPEPKMVPPPQGTQTRNWSSLFKAQAPSKSMKLAHYTDVQKGEEAHVNFDESQLDVEEGKHCLIGNFLDGRMALPLLTATARAVWKDHGKFTVKQLGSCYLFEFEDESAKLGVLEGGPYFFSRRYLVLKEWTRMLVPSKNHPSSIPVWIKLHRLPLEFWTHVGFSKIGSAIGKPICVDEATANRRRLDYARICVEVEAGDFLPNDIVISVNAESVMVGVEYQWLPPRCDSCKVFGHTCSPKAVPKVNIVEQDWIVVGKGHLSASSTLGKDTKGEDSDLKFRDQGTKARDPLLNPLPNPAATHISNKNPLEIPVISGLANSSKPIGADSSSVEAASSSNPSGSVAFKPPPSSSPIILHSTDDTISEDMDEEFEVDDREVDQPTGTLVKARYVHTSQTNKESPNPSPGGQKFSESSSARKKRLKKERKLRKQGSL